MSRYRHGRIPRSTLALATAAVLATAPSSAARPIDDGPTVREWPQTAESRTYTEAQAPTYGAAPATGSSWGPSTELSPNLTEEQVLASRGKSAPRPVVRTAQASSDAGFDWSAAGIGAAGSAGLIVLAALSTTALASRRRRASIAEVTEQVS